MLERLGVELPAAARVLQRRRRWRVEHNGGVAIPQRLRQAMGARRGGGCRSAYRGAARRRAQRRQNRRARCVAQRVHDRRKASAMRPQRLRRTLACIPSV